MSNVIIIVALAIILTFAIKNTVSHFIGESSCCGTGSRDVKTKPAKLDRVVSTKIVKINGMHCEATANVDPENEKDLIEAIDALTKEKTILMIAHRLKTVRNADKIFVVDKGKIVQEGSHDQLMQKEGIYRNFILSRKQAVSWKLA